MAPVFLQETPNRWEHFAMEPLSAIGLRRAPILSSGKDPIDRNRLASFYDARFFQAPGSPSIAGINVDFAVCACEVQVGHGTTYIE